MKKWNSKATVRLVSVVVGLGVYGGLPIAGGGGFASFFAQPARTALMIVLLALSVLSLFTDASISSGVREDRGNRWVIVVFAVIGLLNAYIPAYTDRTGFWTIDGDTARWIGVVIFAAGGALRMWPVFVLGYRFSGLVAIQPGHELVTSGIYRSVRNPSYLGLLINSLGWALGFRSWLGVLLALLLVPPLIARINSEERLLSSEFGEEYKAYCAHTWRLIPGIY